MPVCKIKRRSGNDCALSNQYSSLEVDMRGKMIKYGLTAVALNQDTIEEAQRTRQEDLCGLALL